MTGKRILWMLVFSAVWLGWNAPCWAQYKGQWATGFGLGLMEPTELDTPVGWSLGGNITYYLSHRWSIGISAGMVRAGGNQRELRETFLGLAYGLHFDIGRWHPFFELGVQIYRVHVKPRRRAPVQKATELGAFFGFGMEYFVSPTWSLRVVLEGHDVFTQLDVSFIRLQTSFQAYF